MNQKSRLISLTVIVILALLLASLPALAMEGPEDRPAPSRLVPHWKPGGLGWAVPAPENAPAPKQPTPAPDWSPGPYPTPYP